MVYLLAQWYRIEWFASANDWLMSGFERGSPALPLASLGGVREISALFPFACDSEPGNASMRPCRVLPGDQAGCEVLRLDSALAHQILDVLGNLGKLGTKEVEQFGSGDGRLGRVCREVVPHVGPGEAVHVLRCEVLTQPRLKRSCPPCALVGCVELVNRLAHVHRLWPAGSVQPRKRVADVEPCEAQAERHEVDGARSGEGEDVTAWLEDAQALIPHGDGRNERVPLLAHEATPAGEVVALAVDPASDRLGDVGGVGVGESVGRVADDGVDARVGEGGEDVEAVAVVEDDLVVLVVDAHDPHRS